jgi:DNA-binding MarR family transcriptional regulator
MRAVLEHLEARGRSTVPELARAKAVSRQSVQALADALGEAGLVDLEPNPRHRRSPFLTLSDEGRRVFQAMRRDEQRVFETLAEDFDPAEVAAARRVLARLARRLPAATETAAVGDEGG